MQVFSASRYDWLFGTHYISGGFQWSGKSETRDAGYISCKNQRGGGGGFTVDLGITLVTFGLDGDNETEPISLTGPSYFVARSRSSPNWYLENIGSFTHIFFLRVYVITEKFNPTTIEIDDVIGNTNYVAVTELANQQVKDLRHEGATDSGQDEVFKNLDLASYYDYTPTFDVHGYCITTEWQVQGQAAHDLFAEFQEAKVYNL